MRSDRQIAIKSKKHCKMRSAHLGETVRHLYTSTRQVNGGYHILICSWCGRKK